MTLSPKKYVSNFTSTTTNRGVEAKETEIANTRLDMDSSSSAQQAAGGDAAAGGDDSGSYIQVLVHRAGRAGRAATSSPVPGPGAGPAPGSERGAERPESGDARTAAARERDGTPAVESAGGGDARATDSLRQSKKRRSCPWRKVGGGGSRGAAECRSVSEPAQVRVYGFERGCLLAASGGARRTRAAAAAARWTRAGGAALDEALGAAALVAGAPLGALVRVERAALGAARAALGGAVRAAADEALKPALALSFNAVVRPALVWAGQVCGALRDALRPLWGALGDALEPAARLLAAARLVDVHVHYETPVTHC